VDNIQKDKVKCPLDLKLRFLQGSELDLLNQSINQAINIRLFDDTTSQVI